MARFPGDAPDSAPRPSGPRRSRCERSSDPHSASGSWRVFSRWTSPPRRSPRSRRQRPRRRPRPRVVRPARSSTPRDGNGNSGRTDLMLMKKDGANKTLLLAGASGVAHRAPRWAPDATWIAFYTNAASGNSLRLIRADGTGLTTLVSRCSGASTPPAWRPIPTSNGYWLVYLDARGSDGTCLTSWPPGFTSPGGTSGRSTSARVPPVLAGDPVCLTCDLVAQDGDYWYSPAWSRDGSHLSSISSQARDHRGSPIVPRLRRDLRHRVSGTRARLALRAAGIRSPLNRARRLGALERLLRHEDRRHERDLRPPEVRNRPRK